MGGDADILRNMNSVLSEDMLTPPPDEDILRHMNSEVLGDSPLPLLDEDVLHNMDSSLEPKESAAPAEGGKYSEAWGVPYDPTAIFNILEVPSNIAANVGSVLAEEDYTIDMAFDRILNDLAGITDKSKVEENYDTALATVNDPMARGAVHVAGTLSYFAALPPSTAAAVGKALKLSVMKGGNAAVKQWNQAMLENAYKKVVDTTAEVGVMVAGKSVSPIRKLGTPTSDRLAARMGDDVGEGSGIISMELAVFRQTGKSISALDNALDATKKKHLWTSRLAKKESTTLERGLREGASDVSSKAVRKVLDDHADYLKQAGLITGKVQNWLPRLYDAEAMNNPKVAKLWNDVLTKNGIPLQDAMALRQSIVRRDGFLGTGSTQGVGKMSIGPSGRLTKDLADRGGDVLKKNPALMQRIINIPDSELAPFLKSHDDLRGGLTDYIMTTTRHAEFTKRFGGDYSKLNKDILRIDKELRVSTGAGITQSSVDQIYGLADALLFKYKPLSDSLAGNAGRVFNKIATPAAHMITLPLATMNSLSEVIMPLGRAALRPSSTLHGMKGLINHVSRAVPRAMGLKFIPKAEQTRTIEEVGIGLDAAIIDTVTQLSKGDTSAISTSFFKVIFLQQWTRAMMVLGNETGKAMIRGHLKDIAAGKGNVAAYAKDLEALGVNPDRGVKWVNDGMPSDGKFIEEIKRGGLKFVSDVVMLPRASQLPLWQANPRAKPLALLKSFPTQFGNTVMKNFLVKGITGTPKEKMVIASTVAIGTTLAMASSSTSDKIRYGEEGNPSKKNWTEAQYLFNGFEKMGGFGAAGFAKDAFNSSQYGRSPLDVVAGPVAGILSDISKTAYKVVSKDEGDDAAVGRQISKLIPFANVNKDVKGVVAKTVEDFLADDGPDYSGL